MHEVDLERGHDRKTESQQQDPKPCLAFPAQNKRKREQDHGYDDADNQPAPPRGTEPDPERIGQTKHACEVTNRGRYRV